MSTPTTLTTPPSSTGIPSDLPVPTGADTVQNSTQTRTQEAVIMSSIDLSAVTSLSNKNPVTTTDISDAIIFVHLNLQLASEITQEQADYIYDTIMDAIARIEEEKLRAKNLISYLISTFRIGEKDDNRVVPRLRRRFQNEGMERINELLPLL